MKKILCLVLTLIIVLPLFMACEGSGASVDDIYADMEKNNKQNDEDYIMVSVGGNNYTMAIKKDGTLWAWGYNQFGQLGDGTRTYYEYDDELNATLINNDKSKSNPVKIMDDVIQVCAGYSNTMAIKSDGTLWAWGRNDDGQLGDGTKETKVSPVKIMDDVVQVSTNSNWYSSIYTYTMAVKKDGSLWTWGNNDYGQLGDGTKTYFYYDDDENYIMIDNNKSSPVKIMDDVVQISAGISYAMAIKKDGSLWTWGNNEFGQLGDGTTESKLSPVKIMDDIKLVYMGNNYAMALKKDGSLWSWGINIYGQLGDGTVTTYKNDYYPIIDSVIENNDKSSPVKIIDDVAQVYMRNNYTMVIKNDSSLWAWGKNDKGQLGDKTIEHKSSPVKIMENIKEVFFDGGCAKVKKIDGSTWMWGTGETFVIDGKNKYIFIPSGDDLFVPAYIEKSFFENRILAFIEKDSPRMKLQAYYTLRDPKDLTLTEKAKEELIIKYPITEIMAIYEFDPNASVREITNILGLFKEYTELTREDLIKMYKDMGISIKYIGIPHEITNK